MSHHRGVATADELPNFVKDAFAVDAFVYRTPLHNDCYSQQDLLTDILLETGKNKENLLLCTRETFSKNNG